MGARQLHKLGVISARYTRALFFLLFNAEVLFNVALALLSTWLTSKHMWDIRYKLDNVFLTLAIISPLMSQISLAFNRRETASQNMTELHINCVNLYMLHRDWHRSEPGNTDSVGDNTAPHVVELAELLQDFYKHVKQYVMWKGAHYESHAEFLLSNLNRRAWFSVLFRNKANFRSLRVSMRTDAERQDKAAVEREWESLSCDLRACYERLTRISMWNEKRGVVWGHTRSGADGFEGRTNILLGNIIASLEQLRLSHDYRTPVMLRYGTKILIYVYAFFLGPSFNAQCDSYESFVNTNPTHAKHNPAVDTCYMNYVYAVLLLVSLTVFVRIGSDLEYPFDMKGVDDLFFEMDMDLKLFCKVKPSGEFQQRLLNFDEEGEDNKELLQSGGSLVHVFAAPTLEPTR